MHSNTNEPLPENQATTRKRLPKTGSGFWKLLLSWAIAIGITIFLHAYVFQPFQVFGQSMEPTLHEGDYLIISKLGASFSKLQNKAYLPERGDIVVINPNGTRLIKRVIGLPGETVVAGMGKITVYNASHPSGFNPYQEFGLPDAVASGSITTQVPEGHVYVVGDNRENGHSMDSRNQLGTIPTQDVVGTLLVRLWPPKKLQVF